MNLKKITQSRWFPNSATHLLAGLAAMGIVYGLRAVGVTAVVPWEVNNAITPIVGYLVSAIVRQPVNVQPDPEPAEPPTGTVGEQVAQMLLGDVKDTIDSNPQLLKGLALSLLSGRSSQLPTPQLVDALAKVAPASQEPPAMAEGEAAGVIR